MSESGSPRQRGGYHTVPVVLAVSAGMYHTGTETPTFRTRLAVYWPYWSILGILIGTEHTGHYRIFFFFFFLKFCNF